MTLPYHDFWPSVLDLSALQADLLLKNCPWLWLLNQTGYLLLLFTYGCRQRAMLSSLTTLVLVEQSTTPWHRSLLLRKWLLVTARCLNALGAKWQCKNVSHFAKIPGGSENISSVMLILCIDLSPVAENLLYYQCINVLISICLMTRIIFQNMVQNAVSGMGDLGRNARVSARTSVSQDCPCSISQEMNKMLMLLLRTWLIKMN